MTKQDLINIGFKEIPHFTIGNNLIFNLGRKRQLSIANVGTPNEMVFINQIADENDKAITDLIVLHNYDYDDYITEEKIKAFIFGITG